MARAPSPWWLGLLLLGAIALTGLWLRARRKQAIAELPLPQRRALYQRTLETLRTTCRQEGDVLLEHCREQAAFILQFPECDEACHALADRFAPRPSR